MQFAPNAEVKFEIKPAAQCQNDECNFLFVFLRFWFFLLFVSFIHLFVPSFVDPSLICTTRQASDSIANVFWLDNGINPAKY